MGISFEAPTHSLGQRQNSRNSLAFSVGKSNGSLDRTNKSMKSNNGKQKQVDGFVQLVQTQKQCEELLKENNSLKIQLDQAKDNMMKALNE